MPCGAVTTMAHGRIMPMFALALSIIIIIATTGGVNADISIELCKQSQADVIPSSWYVNGSAAYIKSFLKKNARTSLIYY